MSVEPLFTLPRHWQITTLGEACKRGSGNIQTGPFGSQLHASDYVPVGIPSIMPENIGDNRVVSTDIARITRDDAERLSRYRVRPGDIVYSRRGDVERRALIRDTEDGWLCGTGCLRVRVGDGLLEPAFTSFYLGHPEVRSWIVRHAIGATMPNLNTSILSALPVVIPPIGEQRQIGELLGTLDDKIELNRRTNETLEAIARAIFKSWFVDCDSLPDKQNKDWSLGTFGDVAVNAREQVSPGEAPPETPYIGLEHLPRQSIALSDWGRAGEVASNKFAFSVGDILFGKLRPYFHKVGVAAVDGVCSTDILVIRPKTPEWFAFVLGHASSHEMVNFASAGSTGTKMPRTSWHELGRFEILVPPAGVAKAFNTIVQPLVQRIHANIHESRTLASIRDALLPRLISGEIRIRKAEEKIEAHA